ncbi:maleylpyruvate isomerase N-terminal domain-containing protein [Dactylosporangium salmoneum]|uniref:Mycothiol-dependent maleylpyruvate isomerase metal-binding domain-containing protein n=1 Tax=Dactylosporangium salmoneum TaxID=53361 RepID=A0ABP5T9I6_9ACTN
MPDNRLARAFASTRAVLSTVEPDQLDLSTPCASWDVRSLIDHFVGTARWAGDTIAGTAGAPAFLGRADRPGRGFAARG